MVDYTKITCGPGKSVGCESQHKTTKYDIYCPLAHWHLYDNDMNDLGTISMVDNGKFARFVLDLEPDYNNNKTLILSQEEFYNRLLNFIQNWNRKI